MNLPIKTLVAAMLLLVTVNCSAQKGPLKGSGKIVNKTFDYKAFDKIELQDLDGKVEIETGKTFSITVAIDDNLESLLEVAAKNQELKIELKGNTNNKLYIEETGISIKITLPEISFLKHRGNGNVYVNEIAGNKFAVKNSGNGTIFLNGSISELDITCSGNGTVNAEKLLVKSVTTKRSGNGNVIINTDNSFTGISTGNGNIINKGNGIAGTHSSAKGNSSIIDASHKANKNIYPANENDAKVKSSIRNNTDSRVELKVVYPVKGSYGITIKPGETNKEYFPLGTKIYRKGKMDKPLFEITVENREVVFVIE